MYDIAAVGAKAWDDMVTTTRTFTLDDLLNVPKDGQIYEILGGQLVVWNTPDTNHSLVVAELTHFLMTVQDAGYGYVFPGPHAVAFDYALRGDRSLDVTHPTSTSSSWSARTWRHTVSSR